MKIGASCLSQAFKPAGETPSGSEAFLVFSFLKTRLTSSTQTINTGQMAGRGWQEVLVYVWSADQSGCGVWDWEVSFNVYILWYVHDKCTPVPVPLLHRCYSCNLWVQAAQVSLSLVIVDLSHIEELQLNTAYLPEGAITHCWTAKRSVMKQDKNTRMKHDPWPQTAHTSLIPMLTHFLCHVFWQKMTLDYIHVILLDKNWCYPKGLKWLTICHRPVWMHQMHCILF